MSSPYQSSADTGSGSTGVNLNAHVTGNPIAGNAGGGGTVTVGHTFVIVIGALAGLWALGYAFKSIRM